MSNVIDIRFQGMLGSFPIDVVFQAPSSGVTALYGPSGCGKTSVLRGIAGLNRLPGLVKIGDDVWQDEKSFKPVYRRPIGYVFQEASLFPHLSVAKNLTYGVNKKNRQQSPTFDEVIHLLGIEHLITRAPHNLSGGERQRVAIGRALLSHPRVLLMDEPLSALDKQTREDIMPFLERLRDQLKLPIFYITHDMHEVERLADQLVLMREGKVIAAGALSKLQADPDLPLAQNREAAVSLDAKVKDYDTSSGLVTIQADGGIMIATANKKPEKNQIRLRIAASNVSLARVKPQQSSILNILPARIVSISPTDDFEVLVLLELGENGGGAKLLSRLTRYSCDQLQLESGTQVYAQIKGVAIIARQ